MTNNPNPVFTKPCLVDFFFEVRPTVPLCTDLVTGYPRGLTAHGLVQEPQYLAFEVVDVKKTEEDGSVSGPAIGRLECLLSDLVLNRGTFTRPLDTKNKGKNNSSTISVVVEEASSVKGMAVVTLRGSHLGNQRGCCSARSDTFFTLMRATAAQQWVTVARSEPIENSLNPTWPTLSTSIRQLCNGDPARPLRVVVSDWQKDDKHVPIGFVDVNLNTLLTPGWSGKLTCATGKQRDVGSLAVAAALRTYEPSFAEYLSGGLQMSLAIAVDFTASNGNPKDPRSLHFASGDPTRPNPYEIAIRTVASCLAPYDVTSGGTFACYGYGGQLASGQVSHCFALNGNPKQPGCKGADGVLAAYRQALANVALSGPTCFEPVLRTAVAQAETYAKLPANEFKYHVLLIITDGAIMDVQPTVDMIVRGSRAPLSIIIIGVGDADFSAMEQLHDDKAKLKSSTGTQVARHCVQFVAMQDYANLASSARLAKELLSQLPDQVAQFFTSTGRLPPPPKNKPQAQMAPASPQPEEVAKGEEVAEAV